jgi:hypothetical protein
MRIKGRLAGGLLISLAFSLIPAVAISAEKATPGSKCKVQKQKVVYLDRTYICIKSGKKLVWNKGVKVAVQPNPTPAPSDKANSPQPTQAMPVEKNWERGYRRIFSELSVSSPKKILIETIHSPTVNLVRAVEITKNFSDSVSLYSELLGPIQPFYLVFLSESDNDFYKEQVLKIEGPQGDSSFYMGDHCQVSKQNYCAYGSNKISPKIVFYQILGSQMNRAPESIKISNYHESVHIYQQSLTSESMYSFMPPWFIEGQATFLGNVSTQKFGTIQEIEIQRISQIRGLIATLPTLPKLESTELASLFTRYEKDIEYVTKNSLGYNLGMLMSEYLYLTFGTESVHKLILNTYDNQNWQNSVKNILGLEISELYQKMAIYVLEQVNSQNQ